MLKSREVSSLKRQVEMQMHKWLETNDLTLDELALAKRKSLGNIVLIRYNTAIRRLDQRLLDLDS